MKHQGPISGVAAHGRHVATAGYDNQLILWDDLARAPLARGNHDHLVNQVAFSPDGKRAASASSDYTVRIWDVPTLRLRTVLCEHEDDVEMVAFSPDGARLATCSRDRRVRVFDTDGALLATMTGHADDVISVVWTADGRHVLSSSDDGTVRRWDSHTGMLVECFELDGAQTDALVVTASGRIIAGDDNGQLILIDGDARAKIRAHVAGVKRLVLSEAHGRLASLSYDRSMIVWSLNDDLALTEIGRTTFPAIVWARAAAFCDKDRIVTGTFGSTYATYGVDTNTWRLDGIETYSSFNAVCALRGDLYAIGDAGVLHRNGAPVAMLGSLCNFLAVSRGRLMTGGQLGIVFDALGEEALYQFHAPINCAATFVRDGKELTAYGTYTGEIVVLDHSSQPPIHVTTFKAHGNAIKGIAADERHLFSVSASAEAAYTDIRSFAVTNRIERSHGKIANGCVKVEGGFASISRDLSLRLWRGGQASIVPSPHRNSIKCLAADPSGRIVATGSYSGAIHVFDMRSGNWMHGVRPTAAGISSLTFRDTDNGFVASSYDGHLYFVALDAATLGEKRSSSGN